MSVVYTLFIKSYNQPFEAGIVRFRHEEQLREVRSVSQETGYPNNNTLKKISPVLIPGIKHKGGDSGL